VNQISNQKLSFVLYGIIMYFAGEYVRECVHDVSRNASLMFDIQKILWNTFLLVTWCSLVKIIGVQ
jgi:hypothetical protein